MTEKRSDGDPRARNDRVAEVVMHLEPQILSGELSPGDSLLPERDLSGKLGVSRSVVREALGRLASLGLVERRQGSGTRVAAPSSRPVTLGYHRLFQSGSFSLEEMTVVRLPLEKTIARLAAEHRSEEHLQAMERHQGVLADLSQGQQAHARAELGFHTMLAEASGNQLFQMVLEPLHHLRIEAHREHYSHEEMRRAHAEHEVILDAVRRQDTAGAEEAMERHLGKFLASDD